MKETPSDTSLNDNPKSAADLNSGSGADSEDRIAQLQRERDDLLDQLRRSQAEFLNYQKRSKAQAETDRMYAIRALALDMLGTLDNFERAISAAKNANTEGNPGSIVEGIEIVHKQLLEILIKHGVKPILALNQPFDPNLHEALAQKPASNLPAGTVVEEFMKGYMHHDRVLRPSKVVVSSAS